MQATRTSGWPAGISFRTGRLFHGGPLLIGDGFWTSAYADYQPQYSNQVRLVRIGWWLIFLPLFILTLPFTVIFVRHWREARRRARIGHCLKCGYDLRATPNQCPECGEIPPAKS
jgi:hypothetical protein